LVRVSADAVAVAHDRILGNNILGGEPFGDDGGGLWDPQGARAPATSWVATSPRPIAS
jgi:hypothetical protein